MEIYSKLPSELTEIIISYTDVIACRNGKYINRIRKQDKRYALLKNIPVPIVTLNSVHLMLVNKDVEEPHGYSLVYIFNNNDSTQLRVRFITRFINKVHEDYDIQSYKTYTFNFDKWFRIINYTM